MAWFSEAQALRGRDVALEVDPTHYVNGTSIVPPFPVSTEQVVLGMGCFWGAEEIFWQTPGVYTTAVGYAGGVTPNPTYQETCTGQTGHAEVVLVVFEPERVGFEQILKLFWEGHDPTQGDRQGNDLGSQYRSVIHVPDEDRLAVALASRDRYQIELTGAGYGPITTEIALAGNFYYAETYHQQYLAKNVNGYRCHSATGILFPSAVKPTI